VAEFAGLEPLGGDPAEGQARQAHDREAGRLTHAADLLVAPLAQGDLEPGLAGLVAIEADLARAGRSVVERHPGGPALEIALGHLALHLDDVGLRDVMPRVQQPVGELSVVGEQQRAGGVEIEPPHRVELRIDRLDVLEHRGAPLGVAAGADRQARLVEHEVDEVLGHELAAIDLDPVGAEVCLCSQLAHHLAVDADLAGHDQVLCCPTRRHPGARHDLL
jgi:hypothetical protein